MDGLTLSLQHCFKYNFFHAKSFPSAVDVRPHLLLVAGCSRLI